MKPLILVFVFVLCTTVIFSQDKIVLKIGDKDITIGEFERLYKKNNTVIGEEKQDIEEYLERFINFKLKVIEAENLGLDTTISFLDEFRMYRRELAKPYMTDPATQNTMLQHAYNKSLKEINASHILIQLDPKASPADTLAAWNKIINLKERALKGENFEDLAVEFSGDPSAQTNKGNLGWFSTFRMVYEFEEAAYATPPGQISMPVRTRFGYHIIKVNEVRPARGSVQVAHIFLRAPEDMPPDEAAKTKLSIFAIKDSVNNGISFEEMALKYSDDKNSASQGGVLQWFSTGMMIPEFENTAFSLTEPGQVSEPVQSFYGWHLIKLIDKKMPGSFEEEKDALLGKLNASHFTDIKKKAYINHLKKQHNFSLNRSVLEDFYSWVDTSVFSASWSPENIPDPAICLFSIGDKKINAGEFAEWIAVHQKKTNPYDIRSYVNIQFESFADQAVYDYEESFLEEKYPEFRYILEEYHDGILLFDLTEKMIWNKAIQDSAGLEEFFNRNRGKYSWEARAEALIVTVDDPSLVTEARKATSKYGKKKNFSKEQLVTRLCPDDSTDSCIRIEHGKFEKGMNDVVDATGWEKGLGANTEKDGQIIFVFIRNILPPTLKVLDETRGIVISDYQEYLEEQWIKELREKYPVKIYREILSLIN